MPTTVRAAPAPVVSPAPARLVQRCGGTKCPEGTCDHKGNRLLRSAAGPAPSLAPPAVHHALRSSGQPLDGAARAFMEPRFGHDFSHVRVHADAGAAASADQVGARAYTVGRDVVFAAGQYQPASPEGRRLLAHELTHVAQQGSAPRAVRRATEPVDVTPLAAGEVRRAPRRPPRWSACRAEGVPCPMVGIFNGLPCKMIDCWRAPNAHWPFAISPGICIFECEDGRICTCVLVGSSTNAVCTFKFCDDPVVSAAPREPRDVALAALDQLRPQFGALAAGQPPTVEEDGTATMQAKLRVGEAGDRYEHEADRVADQVMRMPAAGGGGGGHPGLLRDGGATVRRTPAPPRDPVEDAQRAAFIRAQIAYQKLAGIAPPPPPGREGGARLDQLRARALAQKLFQWDDPNMEQITRIVGEMRNRLATRIATVNAPANDPHCGTRAAYVVGLRPPIHLCTTFFNSGAEQQVRTMLHEAAHVSGIGNAGLGESYCLIYDCDTSCGGFDSADSWAHFVNCLSGQPADQPPVIHGQPGGGGTP